MNSTTPNTLILSGSNRDASHSLALATHVQQQLSARAQRSVLVDLRHLDLPFHDPINHHAPQDSGDQRVRDFARLAIGAAAYVWITPIYHGSLSGMLKNALDNLNIPIMSDKPVLLMANGGGRFGGAVFEHMRAMAVNLHAVAINCQILSLASDFDQTTDGYTLSGETVIERIDRGVTELCSYIELFNKERAE